VCDEKNPGEGVAAVIETGGEKKCSKSEKSGSRGGDAITRSPRGDESDGNKRLFKG